MKEHDYFSQFAGEDIDSPIVNDFGEDYDWTENAIPTREFERLLFRFIRTITRDEKSFQRACDDMGQYGSDEQWQIVCNTLDYIEHPDDFEVS